jgi:hypothetical protein
MDDSADPRSYEAIDLGLDSTMSDEEKNVEQKDKKYLEASEQFSMQGKSSHYPYSFHFHFMSEIILDGERVSKVTKKSRGHMTAGKAVSGLVKVVRHCIARFLVGKTSTEDAWMLLLKPFKKFDPNNLNWVGSSFEDIINFNYPMD